MTERTEWQTFILGPYDEVIANSYPYLFPCLPQVRTGHTKVFPPRQTLGPPDPNVDDTLSSLNFMDLSGGQGVSRINVSTDLNRFWWGTADTRGADGWCKSPEVLPLVVGDQSGKPASSTGNCTPIGRVGDGMYALWGLNIHKWDPDAQTWGATVRTLGSACIGDPVVFNERVFFPTTNGYEYTTESGGALAALTVIAGAATPTYTAASKPTTNPFPLIFGIHQQKLWCVTTQAQGYALASSLTGSTGEWFWPQDDFRLSMIKISTTNLPRVLIDWKRPDGDRALWCITKRGGLRYNDSSASWDETDIWDVPPHPNFGKCALPWRPGEALWIATGGGDLLQYTATGVAQPGQGPGGRADGLPFDKRGDVISLASDLANLYALVQGDTSAQETSMVEDPLGSDALVLPDNNAVSSVITNTGKGWHPLWESVDAVGTPTRIVVSDALNAANAADYRVFWGVGETCFSMPCRLSMYSARQGRQAENLSRFSTRVDYIEWGEFNAGSIAVKKHFSHAAILLEHASPGSEYVEYAYQLDSDSSGTWNGIELSGSPILAETPNARTIFPFGLSADGQWSAGLAAYWIKQRIALQGVGAFTSPTVQALTLAFMPLPADASHQIFTIPLPVETDERSGKTREQITNQLVEYLESEEMLYMRFGVTIYRAYVAGMSGVEVAGIDAAGAITLNVIQIPTGLASLVGES